MELRGLKKDGKEFPIELSLSEWGALDKRYFTGIIRDISSRKAAEEEIQFRNIILSTQQETSIEGILVVDENSEIVSYNGQFIRMWRIPQELVDLKSDEPVLRFVANQVAETDSFIQRVEYLYAHKNETCHEQIILKNGNIFDRYSAPMIGKDERYYGRVWYFRDITERKHFEDALRESEERLRVTMEVTNIGIWNWNVEKDIWNASATYYTMLGYEPVIGPVDREAWLKLVHPDDRKEVNDKINKVLNGRIMEYNYEARIKHADGSYRWNSVIGKTVEWDSNGAPKFLIGVRIDITKQKEAEEKIYKSENRYRSLFENAAIAIWEEDLSEVRIYLNQLKENGIHDFRSYFNDRTDEVVRCASMVKLLDVNNEGVNLFKGSSKEEILKSLHSFFIEESLEGAKEELIGLAEGKLRIDGEIPVKIANGEIKQILFQLVIVPGFEETWSKVLFSFVDVTEKKENSKKITLLARALESINECITITDLNDNLTFVNVAFCKVYGYHYNELIGKNISIVRSENNPVEISQEILPKTFKGGWQGELLNKRKNGEEFPVYLSTSVIYDDKNKPAGLLGVTSDISERKLSEEALRYQQYLMNTLMDNTTDHIHFKDKESRFIRISRSQAKAYGLNNPNETIGKTDVDFFSDEHARQAYDDEQKIIQTGIPVIGIEEKETWPDGHETWVSSTKLPFFNKENEIIGTFGISRDITEYKRNQAELIRAKEKAEQMNRLKNNFLNNLSHEMRTPLVAILGYSDFLLNEVHNSEHEEMVRGIAGGGQRLLQTINSLLDLATIESKKIDLQLVEVDIISEIEEVINEVSVLAEKKNLYLRLVKKDRNVFSLLDAESFTQIVKNLLDNAIKFTLNGGVTIEIDKNILEDKSWSVIRISDTGIGISRDNLDIIFEEFRQMSEGLARKFEGTGLGLTLAKKLADLMDGKITVESEFGKGSIFTIMFKSITHTSNKNNNKERFESEPGSKFPEMTEDKIFTGRRILAVDDDFIARNLLRLWLKDMYKMEFAVNGESAIQMAMNNNYDAVLMDMNLGNGFNGLDVTQKIKAMANYQNVPIIAVTAYAMDRDRIKFLNNGCAYYLSKPFNKNTIIELLNRALNVEVS